MVAAGGLLAVGRSEREVAADLEHAMRRAGSDGVAFETIIASGPNGAHPHHVPADRVLADGDLVVVDFGATVAGYASDCTRTVALGGAADRVRTSASTASGASAGPRRRPRTPGTYSREITCPTPGACSTTWSS